MIENILGYCGVMISSSKRMYSDLSKEAKCFYNANVIVNNKKVWYGDIDLNKSEDGLRAVAKQDGSKIYILRESDGRFQNDFETYDDEYLKKRSVWSS